jgi:hypothetical protein
VRIADIAGKGFSLFYDGTLADDTCNLGWPGLGISAFCFVVAPLRDDVLSVVPVGDAVRGKILPEVPACRLAASGTLSSA